MTAWEVPESGTWHLKVGAEPHRFDDCGDWCVGQGWKPWYAKGAVVDLDEEPAVDPTRSRIPGWMP